VADDYERICCTTAANVTRAMWEWDTSLGEVSRKLHKFVALKTVDRITSDRIDCGGPLAGAGDAGLSRFTDLRQSVRTNFARINWGAPLAVSNIRERVCFTAAANLTLTLSEWDTSSREMSSTFSKLTDLMRTGAPRGRRAPSQGGNLPLRNEDEVRQKEVEGGSSGNGDISRSHRPSRGKHVTARGLL
jgi:hypothetical protein